MKKFKTVVIRTKKNEEKGLLGKKELDTVNDEELALNIENSCNDLISNGYTIVSITPITSGGNNFKNGVGYGYGFSYTSSVIISAIES